MTMATKLNENEMWEMMMAPRLNGHIKLGRPWQHLGEEHQHRHAHADLRDDDRQAERTLQSRLAGKPESPEQKGGHGSQDHRHHGRGGGDGQGIAKGGNEVSVGEGRLVVLPGEAAPHDVALESLKLNAISVTRGA